MPQVGRTEQHPPAPPAGPEPLPQRPGPSPPAPAQPTLRRPPELNRTGTTFRERPFPSPRQPQDDEQPVAIPVIHALDRPYRVEIQLEGDLKISGELKGFSLTPADESDE